MKRKKPTELDNENKKGISPIPVFLHVGLLFHMPATTTAYRRRRSTGTLVAATQGVLGCSPSPNVYSNVCMNGSCISRQIDSTIVASSRQLYHSLCANVEIMILFFLSSASSYPSLRRGVEYLSMWREIREMHVQQINHRSYCLRESMRKNNFCWQHSQM